MEGVGRFIEAGNSHGLRFGPMERISTSDYGSEGWGFESLRAAPLGGRRARTLQPKPHENSLFGGNESCYCLNISYDEVGKDFLGGGPHETF